MSSRRKPAVGDARPLRVLHYVATAVPGTGIDTFVLQLCAAQKRFGIVPSIACDPGEREAFMASARALEAKVHPLVQRDTRSERSNRLVRKVETARLLALGVRALKTILVEARIDVVHVHAVAVSGLEAHVASGAAGVPVIVTHHATLEWLKPMWTRATDVTLWLEKRRAAFSVCPYQRVADELVERGMSPERISVVPFCADETRFSGSITPPTPSGPIRMVMVARLVPGKGHDDLLQAMAKVRAQHPRLRLTIAGDGPTRPDLEAAITRLGLGDVVEMRGHVSHAEVPDLMRASHVVVLPSRMMGETFPVCLLEGMCLGMPAIGTRWFGIPDIIADGETGLLVDPGDVDGLAAAIDKLAGDPDLFAKTSREAARHATTHFTATAVAKRYRELYDRASGGER